MKYVADLHLHSKFSRAVSPNMTIPTLAEWGRKKGIKLLSTSDFTHPIWFNSLKEELVEDGTGFYKAKNTSQDVRFVLGTELSCIYPQGGKLRRIHILVFAPNFPTVEKINQAVSKRGKLASDGRPIFGMSAKELTSILLGINPDCLIVPAHCWTPWFALYGSNSGFDSIEECFGDLSKYIYAVETGLSCYDKDTEVLTDNGWKKFPDVQYSDEICTLNLETNQVQFQRPTKLHSYLYKGKMYRLKTKRVDLLVTPNHMLLVSGCDFRKPPQFFLKESELLIGKSKRFKKNGVWIGAGPADFILPAVKIKHGSRYYFGERIKNEKRLPIIPWLKFFGFWLAEGWATEGNNGDYNVCLANKDGTLLSEMKDILESFGYQVYWSRKTNSILRIRDYQLYNYLKQFGKSPNKFIPSEVKSLSKELLETFFVYYIKGDGHRYGRDGKGLSATTISVRLRDDLQEIALKLGMSAYYRLHRKKGTLFKSPGHDYNKIYKQSADSWVIYFIRRNIHAVLPSRIKKYKHIEKWVDFDGKVFCATVPNKVVYVRRNGIPVWCGNSDPAMNWRLSELDNRAILSFSDAHSPAKVGREATIFEGELSYEGLIGAIRGIGENKVVGTTEFFPEEGKYHFTGHRSCGVKQDPKETKEKGEICPVCQRRLTVGVMHRVEQLADRIEEQLGLTKVGGWIKSSNLPRAPFRRLVPLQEIIAEALGTAPSSQKVVSEFEKLVNSLGSEIEILLRAKREDIEKVSHPRIAEGIEKVRNEDIIVDPGFDGVYGVVKIWPETKREAKLDQPKSEKKPSKPKDENQLNLFGK